MTIVDEMHKIPPIKIDVLSDQSRKCPTPIVAAIMPKTINATVILPDLPTFIRLLKLNSSPRANSRKMTPISLHVSMFCMSCTLGSNDTCGPVKTPAIIYPSKIGSLNFLHTTEVIPAAMRIKARSVIKGYSCIIVVIFQKQSKKMR